jgi:hypothetical protein
MMNRNIFYLGIGCLLLCVACTKDLDRTPTNSITSEKAYQSLAGYKQVLAKVYGSFALPGKALIPGRAIFSGCSGTRRNCPRKRQPAYGMIPGYRTFTT